MSASEELKLIISGDTKLLGTAMKDSEKMVRTTTKNIAVDYDKLKTRIQTSLKKAFIINPVTAIGGFASGTALLLAGKAIIDFDDKLMRLAINSRITAKEQIELREQIANTAYASGQSRLDILGGIGKIVEQTGDLKFAKDVMKDLAIASTATGAKMEYLGSVAVQLRDKIGLANGEIKTALNLLTVQGKAGAFTLENLATMGPRLFAAAGRFDMKGLKDLANYGAFVQVAMMGTGSPETAATSVEGVLADILDKQVQIKKIGFDIMGPDNKIKTFDSIIKGIITATKGNESILGSIFGRESIRSISMLAKAYRDTGGFKLFDELSNADAGNANEILKDFAQYSKSARFQLMQLSNIAWDFADSALSPVIEDLNKYLSELTNNPEKLAKFREEIGQIGKNIGTTAASVADLVAALSKFIPLLKIMGVAVDYTTGPFQLGHYLANDYSNDKNSADAAIAKYNAPIIKQRVASILEWEKKSGVRFRNDNIIRNVINAEINISDSGRVAVRTNDSNATIKANVNRGSFPGVRK